MVRSLLQEDSTKIVKTKKNSIRLYKVFTDNTTRRYNYFPKIWQVGQEFIIFLPGLTYGSILYHLYTVLVSERVVVLKMYNGKVIGILSLDLLGIISKKCLVLPGEFK